MQKKKEQKAISMLLVVIMISTIFVGVTLPITHATSVESVSISTSDMSSIGQITFGVEKTTTPPVMDGIINIDEYGAPVAVVNYGDPGVYWNGDLLDDATMSAVLPEDMTIYTTYDDTNLYVAVTVYDENHWTPGEGLDVWDGDYLEIDISTNIDGGFDAMRDRSRFAIGISNAGNVCIYSALKQSNVNATYTSYPYIFDDSYGNVTRDETTKITTYELRLPWKDISHTGKPVDKAFFMVQAGVGHEDYADESEYDAYLGVLRWAAQVPFELLAEVGGGAVYHVAEFIGTSPSVNNRAQAGKTNVAPNFSYGANGQDYVSGQEYYFLKNDLIQVNFFNGEVGNNAVGPFCKGAPADFVALSSGRENVDWSLFRMKPNMDAAWDDKNSNLDLLLSIGDYNTIIAEGFAKNVPGMDAKVTYSLVNDALPVMMIEVVLTNNGASDYKGFFEYLVDPDESGEQVSYVPGVGYKTSNGAYITSGWTENYLFNGPNAKASPYTSHTIIWPDDQQPTGLVNEGYISGVWFNADTKAGESKTLVFYHAVTVPTNAAAPFAEAAVYASILSNGGDIPNFDVLVGKITDSVTKEGVPFTSVTAKYAVGEKQGETAATVMTDANGRYAMVVEKDVYTLTATALSYKQASASIDMTAVAPELSFEMQPLDGARALRGVPLNQFGSGVEATPNDFVMENDKIALSIVDTGNDPQVPIPFTKGRILDMSTLEVSYDGLDWIYTSWLTNRPVTGEQWNRYTTSFNTIEITQNTPEAVTITATGVYDESLQANPAARTCDVVQVATIKPGDYYITLETTVTNVSGGTYSLYAGDILDYDFGGAQVSYAPGIGEITLDSFRSGVLTEPWIAQYGRGAGAAKQSYGIVYDELWPGEKMNGFGFNRWMGAYHYVTLENGESFTYSRKIVAIPNDDFENPWDCIAALYSGLGSGLGISIEFDNVLYEVGDYVTAKVIVSNDGDEALEGIRVFVTTPYQLVAADGGIVEIPVLEAGASEEVTITMRAVEGGRGKIYYNVSYGGFNQRYTSAVSISGPGWYGGDNHSHTTYSDGSGSIKDNVDAAYNQGLSWLYSTDHNSIRQYVDSETITLTFNGDFFNIAGNEITSNIGHALGYQIPYANSSVYNVNLNLMPNAGRTWQTVINEVYADGGYFYVAHPNYPGLEFRDMYNIRDYAGIEVWNGFYHPIDPDRNVSTQAFLYWDEINSRGESKYFGIANSDGHNPGKQADPYSMGYMDVLSIENINDTLRNGKFFGTNGPQLRFDIDGVSYGETLYINGNSKTASVTISAFDDLYPLTKVTLYKLEVTGVAKDTKTIAKTWDLTGLGLYSWSETFDLTVSDKEFYRVEITSAGGTTGDGGAGIGSGTGFAFSNPIWIESSSFENQAKICDMTLNNPKASLMQNRSGVYYVVTNAVNTLTAEQLNVTVSAGATVVKTYDAVNEVFLVTVTSPDGTNINKMSVYVVPGMVEVATFEAEDLTLTPGSTQSDMNFTWYSDREDNTASVVQITKTSSLVNGEFPATGVTTLTGTVGNAVAGKSWHKAGVTGLAADTEYSYRVSNDGVLFSEIYSFKTGSAGDFQFIAVGDPQLAGLQDSNSITQPPGTTAEGWRNTLNLIREYFPNASFMAGTGDQVDTATSESQYTDYFSPEYLRSLPVAPAVGNHEGTAANFGYHFNVPNETEGSYFGNYWYVYNNALFVVLNTAPYPATTAEALEYIAVMDQTLSAATSANPDVQWIFVQHHKSTASPASHQTDADVLIWAPEFNKLMDKYGVDFVLAGHDHVYSRSWFIYDNEKVEGIDYGSDTVTNPKGTLYLTLSTASGLKYYDFLNNAPGSPAWVDDNSGLYFEDMYGVKDLSGIAGKPWYTNIGIQVKAPQFTAVDVTSDSVTFTTYRTDTMEIIDQYTVCKAEVIDVIPVTGVKTDKEDMFLAVGETGQIKATVYPIDATDKNVTWSSSNESVATVDGNGLVTAVSAGQITIVVTTADGHYEALFTVYVRNAVEHVTGVTLDKDSMTLPLYGNEKITATVSPFDAMDKRIIWSSSDGMIANVDASGKVTGISVGTAIITATTVDGNYTATCVVTVAVPVTGVAIDKSAMSLTVGSTGKITATISPAKATDKSVTWASSDELVATVDGDGLVTAVGAGTATITVTTNDGGYTATCEVTVAPPIVHVTLVEIDKSSMTLMIGSTGKIMATVHPSDATDRSVVWFSDDESVATVNDEGIVTAVGAGTAAVFVRTVDGNYVGICFVTVAAPIVHVTGVDIDKEEMFLSVGEAGQITAEVSPPDATDRSVTWLSSDELVATVDGNGLVTAVGAGMAAIFVKTVDGNFVELCIVTVSGGPE